MSSIKCFAAVSWGPKQPLDYTEIEVAAPKSHEVRLRVFSNALCHTDVYTLDGHDPEGLFPCILGHEAAAMVESIGPDVTSVTVGDIVIPCYTPECQEFDCVFCNSDQTNLCPKIRATQGKGLMPDGTSRFSKDGKVIYHFMGCSTFSEYTVVAEISLAKISPFADVNKICLLGCGISTGWGAAYNTCKVSSGKSVVVFGLGAVGLAVVQACKELAAGKIIAIDTNEEKFVLAKSLGADECYNPLESNIKDFLLAKEKWGYDFTFDCTGNVEVMRTALEVSHRGYGVSCIIGVAASGHEIKTRPFQLVTGRIWKGTAFGGWKSRSEVPVLVQKVLRGDTTIDPFITHNFKGLKSVNEAIDSLHSGKCLRAVIQISDREDAPKSMPLTLLSKIRSFNGWMCRYKHYSNVNNCDMTFSIYVPDTPSSQRGYKFPGIYYLSGLSCTDENAVMKSGFQQYASQYGLIMVFPDTSPRGVSIVGDSDSWDFGVSAGFYLDATEAKWSKNYNMYSYVTSELPNLIEEYFSIDGTRTGIMGHSMGGHGALISFLKNPKKYKSVSAFSPICNPCNSGWGQKAFNGYLGSIDKGVEWDACELAKKFNGKCEEILIDQGTADRFKDELKGEEFEKICRAKGIAIKYRMQKQFDHSYYFVASFIGDHIKHHAKILGAF